MKSIKKITLLFFVLILSQYCKGAVVEVTDGSLAALKGSTLINIQYDFSDLLVSGYPTLEEYITYKKKKYQDVNPGKSGEEWYKNWLFNRENVMIPKFEEVMNKKMDKCGIVVKQKSAAKYTLIVKVNHYIEAQTGFPYFIGMATMFEAKAYLVETAAPDTKLATIRADYLRDAGDLGGSIGNLICKSLK